MIKELMQENFPFKEGIMGTSDLQSVRSTGNNLDLPLASEGKGHLTGLSQQAVNLILPLAGWCQN